MIAHAAAAGAAIGAWWAIPVPALVALSGAGAALRWRRPLVVGLAMLALAGFASNRAVDGLDPPDPGPVRSWVTLLDDPRPLGTSGVVATVRWSGRRLEAVAHGSARARLDDRLAGERVLVEGQVAAVDTEWLRWRHVVGRLTVERVIDHDGAAPVFAAANSIRRTLVDGASTLSREQRSLFTGMVLGDDRDQSAALADDFRAAGLGHLLVVSGQNVAFVLALTSPITTRFRPGGRLVAVAVLLLVFAVLTRFEPSVMRAVVMAGLAVGAAVLGRPEHGRSVLAAAVAVVVIVDPFLVRVLAFQLSVAATAGIVWLAPAIAERLPGPRAPALAAATTIGAQTAVTPLLVATFGSVPLASLPANLLAGPASGPVMMWGCTGGLVAGIAGGPVARVLHWPTATLLWWVAGVARAAALAPPVSLGASTGGVVVVAVAGFAISKRRAVRAGSVVAVFVVFVVAILAAPTPPAGWSSVEGATLFRSEDSLVVVLDDARSPERLLESLRSAGAGRPALVVAPDGGARDAHAVVALADRFGRIAVIAPPLHRVPGARTAAPGQILRVGAATVEVVATQPTLSVDVRPAIATRSALHGVG